MREIPLPSRKYLGHVAIVDDVDYLLVSQHRWNITARPNGRFYAIARINGHYVYMHRFILGASPLDPQVDHVDHDGLHNWRSNIRFATRSQNYANAPPRIGGVSDFKGVSLDKRRGKWQARGRIKNKRVYLGTFNTELEAAEAYNVFALKHHGEFACLNEVPN